MPDIKRSLIFLSFIALVSIGPAVRGQMPALPPPSLPAMPAQPAVQPAPGLPAAAPAAGSTAAPALPSLKPEPPLPPVSISARVEQISVPRDDLARLVITIEYSRAASDSSAPLDFEFPDPPKGDGLALIGNSLTAATTLEGSTVTVTRNYTYELRAEKEGQLKIGPVAVKYFRIGSANKSSLSTQEIPLTVTRPRLKLANLSKNPWAIAGLALVVVAAVAALVWPRLRGRKKVAATAPVKTAFDLARERLLEVDRLRMAGEHESFVAALAAELDRFIALTLGIKARPGAERNEAVAGMLGSDWSGRLAAAEHLADQVKFAGHKPTGPEMDEITGTARRLVEDSERGAASKAAGLEGSSE